MSQDLLLKIQKLQFTNKSEAEALLLKFMQSVFQELGIISVELRPQAVSLNSFNGFLACDDGSRLFFKTHVEQDNVIDEYYNAAMLADAGYPVIKPLYVSKETGRQILIYELVDAPSVFDVARALETNAKGQVFDLETLTMLQNRADDELLAIYMNTLSIQDSDSSTRQPIHQLFYHRLKGGRLDRFYGDNIEIELPNGHNMMRDICRYNWVINNVEYEDSLNNIIKRAVQQLNPHAEQPTIIGHGDAHNGNVFYLPEGLSYFDPAFAGRHHPLLDLTKPLFHNVYAMWMYFPVEEKQQLNISMKIKDGYIHVEHDYQLNPVRQMFWNSKIERVLIPVLRKLKQDKHLHADWKTYLKCALFCCPFLTLNLTGFPPEITLLGLAMAVEMGSNSAKDTISDLDLKLESIALQV